LLAWGLTASVSGLALVTNFRGYADYFHQRVKGSRAATLSPLMVRLLGLPFAIAGPIVIVTALVTSRRSFAIVSSAPIPLTSPFQYLFIAVTAGIVAWWWIRGAYSLRAADGDSPDEPKTTGHSNG
jgi:hypothetical protein